MKQIKRRRHEKDGEKILRDEIATRVTIDRLIWRAIRVFSCRSRCRIAVKSAMMNHFEDRWLVFSSIILLLLFLFVRWPENGEETTGAVTKTTTATSFD